jgi:hypothetical protein
MYLVNEHPPKFPSVAPRSVIFIPKPSSNILMVPHKRSPPLGSPNRGPKERDAPLSEPFYCFLKFLVNRLLTLHRFLNRPLQGETPVFRTYTHSLVIYLFLKHPSN